MQPDPDKTADPSLSAPFGAYAPTAGQAMLLAVGRHVPLMNRGRLRWQLGGWIERLRPGPIDIESMGVRFRFFSLCDTDTLKIVFAPRRFDSEEIRFFAGNGQGAQVFVDVGANMGAYGLMAASSRPEAIVIFCEPGPDELRQLRANIAVNDLGERAKVFDCAIGYKEARMTFHLAGTKSSLVAETTMPGIEVRVRPLLDVLREVGISRIDGLKVDVEGYEDRVLGPFLAHAPEALRPKRIVIEHILAEHWERDAIALCTEAGYRTARRVGFNTLLERNA